MAEAIALSCYVAADRQAWDDLVDLARNGGFWFRRGYLEYHGSRFDEISLMARDSRGRLVAVMPAHREGAELVSHAGLPFAGWILGPKCRLEHVEGLLDAQAAWMRAHKLVRWRFTAVPAPYCREPCDELTHCLHQRGGRLAALRLTSMCRIAEDGRPRLLSGERWKKIRKSARDFPYEFAVEDDPARVWPTLVDFLEGKFGRRPVHTAEEIGLLKRRFPDAIQMLVAREGDRLMGGQLHLLFDQVLRAQYVFRVDTGRDDYLGARLDLAALARPAWWRPWLDLGTSIDPASGQLNRSLYQSKEYVGARGVRIESWQWDLDEAAL